MSCWVEHTLILGHLGQGRKRRGPTTPRAGEPEGRGRGGLPAGAPLTPAAARPTWRAHGPLRRTRGGAGELGTQAGA